MVVNAQSLAGEHAGRRVTRGRERHVAAVAAGLGALRVVEAVDPVPGNAAGQEGTVVILAAQPAVVIQLLGQGDLVTGAAELRTLVQGTEQGPLVEGRLGPDQLPADRRQKGVGLSSNG